MSRPGIPYAELAEGTHCKTCGRYAKLYSRRITTSMAASLALLGQESPGAFVDYATIVRGHPTLSLGTDYSKLSHWGLAERDPQRLGWWRITPKGRQFLTGEILVPKHAYVFDNEVWGFSRETVAARDVMKFDLQELLAPTVLETPA